MDRDAFWALKRSLYEDHRKYEDIWLPKNSPLSMVIGLLALAAGFAIVWHIWWLVIISILAIIFVVIFRSMDQETEYLIPANEVAKMDQAHLIKGLV